jgi:hypothetical protein
VWYFGRSGEIDPDRAAESRLADLEIDVVENHLMHAPVSCAFRINDSVVMSPETFDSQTSSSRGLDHAVMSAGRVVDHLAPLLVLCVRKAHWPDTDVPITYRRYNSHTTAVRRRPSRNCQQ